MLSTGDIIFVRGHSLLAKLIRYFDPGKFSHVCMAVGPSHIVEAQYPWGVRIKRFKYKDYEIVHQDLEATGKHIVRVCAIAQVGRGYDWKKFIYYGIRKFIPWLKVWNSPKDELCAEVIEIIQGALGKTHTGMQDLTPNELYNYFTNR